MSPANAPKRDEVLAYLVQTGCSAAAAATHFGVPPSTVRSWVNRGRKGLPASTTGLENADTPPRAHARGADAPKPNQRAVQSPELPPDDRARAIQIVRDGRDIVGLAMAFYVERLRAQDLQPAEMAKLLDARASQFLLNMERAVGSVLETHPDLLTLTDTGGDGREGEEQLLENALAAMGCADITTTNTKGSA